MESNIPLNKPFITGNELEYIASAIAEVKLAGDGRFTRGCARLLEEQFGIQKVLMTPSCTAALEMAAMLCDLRAGDEVIMPSFNFVSTANAVARLGARPVFVDIRPDTLNLNESLIENAITERTKAIMPVHYAGVACDMDEIMAIAKKHKLYVIEDAAQGVNAFYKGRALGTIGQLGAYSFHDTKNYIAGEGGALCINSEDMIERAEIIREKGTNRSKFFRGEVDKYTWVEIGSSYIPSEIACAFLLAQLEAMGEITARRRSAYHFYRINLTPLQERGLLTLPHLPRHLKSNFHIFYILLNDDATRDGLMRHLKSQGIQAVFHYVPLHSSPMGQSFGYKADDLPVTESLSARLLRLPLFADITEEEQMRVITCLSDYLEHNASGKPQPAAVRQEG
ncbi:MAG TPA: dTDP-4-amino-4,6-dideoxygalactose transaminase [Blastocatellia bacterium]|nr:dTDP-4-amino-4,6-dideoxygalactose transaminase [Blastocatellia bacterium]